MEGLELEFGDAGGSRAAGLWAELAQGVGQPPEADGARIAAALEPGSPELLARVLPGVLDLVGVEPAATRLVGRVDEVVRHVKPELLTASLGQLDLANRRSFAEDACDHLSPEALVPLVSAAAPTYGVPISQAFGELVVKLARESSQGPEALRARADASFRSLVRHVVGRWSAAQVDAGANRYESMFQRRGGEARARTRVAPESLRLLQLSLETGAVGAMVWSALSENIETDAGMRKLVDLLKQAPESRARSTIADQLATPQRLAALLAEEPVDWDAVDLLLPHTGSSAIRPLLDMLVESNQRATRRALMDRLVRFGPEIQGPVLERLHDRRWYVARNMIGLLREAGCSLEKVPVEPFVQHADARVRREMLQLRMNDESQRDMALAEALLDPDKQVLRAALQAARSHFPATAAAMLAQRVTDATFPPEFRVLSLYLLGRSGQPTALDALLHFVQGGRTLFGKAKLAPTTPEMLAALSGLARSWPTDRRVRELLEVAGRSNDAQIHNALQSGTGREERQ